MSKHVLYVENVDGNRFFATYAIDFGFSIICKKKEQKTGKGKVIITMTKLKYYDDDVLTYVGGKKWAVEQRKEHRDGITQR